MKKIIAIIGILIIGLVAGVCLGYFIWVSEPEIGTKEIKETTNNTSKEVVHDPHTMHDTMEGMSQSLKGKKGDDLDRAFLSEMITHHQGAVDMAQIVLDNSDRLDLRKFAEDIILVQSKEIKMMMEWNDKWFQENDNREIMPIIEER